VDLAGSERLKKTSTDGTARGESMYINRSLTFLEQVVVALSSKGRSHVPYRQSKLTHMLKDSLGGNCKTLLIANVYGEAAHLEETISTLQFAARVRLVPNEAVLNQEQDPEMLLKRYAMQISDLKRELSMHNSLASRSRIAYEPYSDSQRAELLQELEDYLGAGDGARDIDLQSVRQMRELLSAMKSLYSKQSDELDQCQKLADAGGVLGGGGGGELAQSGGVGGAGLGGEYTADDGVGDDQSPNTRGIAVGVAPDHAKPSNGLVEPPSYQRDFVEADDGDSTPAAAAKPLVTHGVLGRAEAYAMFKADEGALKNGALLDAKRTLKSFKTTRSEAAAKVNTIKLRIDELKLERESFAPKLGRASPVDTEDAIIDEDEYKVITELKTKKDDYKRFHEEMRAAARELGQAEASVNTAREELLTEFNEWYFDRYGPDAVDAAPAAAPPAERKGDVMDDDEQFEQMQMARVMEEEPDSLAFVRARKEVSKKQANKPAARR